MKKIIVLALGLTVFFTAGCGQKSSKEYDLNIKGAWVMEVPETQTMSAAFMEISNNGSSDEVLMSANAEIAGTTELHEMINENDQMKMRKIDSISIPAGGSVELKRGGLHVMLIDLKKLPVAGEKVMITLHFKGSGEIVVEAPVKKAEMEMKHH